MSRGKWIVSFLFFLRFLGQSSRLPIDLIIGNKPTASSNHPAYVKDWQTAMKETYELAAKKRQLSGIKGKKQNKTV